MLKDFATLQALLRDEEFDANVVLKDIEDVLYVNASRMHRRLDRDLILELRSVYFEDIWTMDRPVEEPLRFIHSHAKRVIYASTPRHVSLDSLPPVFVATTRTENPCDILAPVLGTALHQKIKDTYEELVGPITYTQAAAIAATQSYLGQMIAGAMFKRMGQGVTGYEPTIIADEDEEVSCLNLSTREKEVLIGVICAKLGKKWAPPAYVLMGDTFVLALFSFLGSAFAPEQEGYFRNVFLSSRVYCHLTKLYRERGKESAERACGKRFGLRRRDVQNRFGHIVRLLKRYDAFTATYCRQLWTDAVHAGIVSRDRKRLRAASEKSQQVSGSEGEARSPDGEHSGEPSD